MTWVDAITNSPNQSITLKTEAGNAVGFNLMYSESQRGWFYSLTYGTMTFNNRRLVTSVNLLRGFRNILPFGLACTTNDNYEPVFIDDFMKGRARVFILNQLDVISIENSLGGVQLQ
jgi:hypothetical protein